MLHFGALTEDIGLAMTGKHRVSRVSRNVVWALDRN